MADQKLVAIHHVPLFNCTIILLDLRSLLLLEKVSSLVHFDCLSSQA